jgi:hypothetical protein
MRFTFILGWARRILGWAAPPPPFATPLLTTGGQYMKFAHAHICHRKMQDYLFLFIIFQVKLLMIHKCTETTYT